MSVFYIWNIVQSVNRSKGIKRNLLASSFSLFQKTIKIIFFSLILLLPILIILIVVMIKIRYISLRETQLWYDTSVDGGPHCDQMGEEKLAQFPQKLPQKSFHNSLYFHSGAFQKSQTDYQIFGCYCYKICCQKLSKIAQSGRADVRGGSI